MADAAVRGNETVIAETAAMAAVGDRVALIWFEPDSVGDRQGPGRVMYSERGSGGSWSPPAVLHGAASYVAPQLVGNAQGLTAAWVDEGAVVIARRSAPGEWDIATTPGAATEVSVAATDQPVTTVLTAREDGVYAQDFLDDSKAPAAWVVRPKGDTLNGRVRVAWRTSDDLAGVRGIDLRMRVAGRDGRLSPWRMSLKGSSASSVARAAHPGQTLCVSVRATDRVGNTGRWSAPRCVSAALDDRALRATAGWHRIKNRPAYRGTLSTAAGRGEWLVLRVP